MERNELKALQHTKIQKCINITIIVADLTIKIHIYRLLQLKYITSWLFNIKLSITYENIRQAKLKLANQFYQKCTVNNIITK